MRRSHHKVRRTALSLKDLLRNERYDLDKYLEIYLKSSSDLKPQGMEKQAFYPLGTWSRRSLRKNMNLWGLTGAAAQMDRRPSGCERRRSSGQEALGSRLIARQSFEVIGELFHFRDALGRHFKAAPRQIVDNIGKGRDAGPFEQAVMAWP